MLVRFFAAAAAATGLEEQRINLPAGPGTEPFRLADLSALLETSFPVSASSHTPPLSDLLSRCSFLLNEVSTRDLAMTLKPGDVVDVLPPFAGG